MKIINVFDLHYKNFLFQIECSTAGELEEFKKKITREFPDIKVVFHISYSGEGGQK